MSEQSSKFDDEAFQNAMDELLGLPGKSDTPGSEENIPPDDETSDTM